MSLLECSALDSLSDTTLRVLVLELSLESPNPQRDWRGFADRIGFSFRHIRTLEQQSLPGKAMQVLEIWDHSGKSSLRKLILVLIHLSLVSCLDVLKEDRNLQGAWLHVCCIPNRDRCASVVHCTAYRPNSFAIDPSSSWVTFFWWVGSYMSATRVYILPQPATYHACSL